MNYKLKSDLIRLKIKELNNKGIQYKLFWNACGISKSRFYNFTGGKIRLKKEEVILLENYLKDNFNISLK